MSGWQLGLVTTGIVVVAALGAALTGSPVVARLLRRFTVSDADGGRTPEMLAHPVGLDNGGRWIGYLERAAVAAGLIAGYPEAVAVVLAVKGLGRYPELRADHGPARDADAALLLPEEPRSAAEPPRVPPPGLTAERFIIGTLASYLWAASWGLAGLGILVAIS